MTYIPVVHIRFLYMFKGYKFCVGPSVYKVFSESVKLYLTATTHVVYIYIEWEWDKNAMNIFLNW